MSRVGALIWAEAPGLQSATPATLNPPPHMTGPRLPGRVASIPRCVSTSVERWVPLPRIHLRPLAKTEHSLDCIRLPPSSSLAAALSPACFSLAAVFFRSHRPFTRRRGPRWLQFVRSDVWGIFCRTHRRTSPPPPRDGDLQGLRRDVARRVPANSASTPSGSEHLRPHPLDSRPPRPLLPSSAPLERPNHGAPTPSRRRGAGRQQTSAGHVRSLPPFLSRHRIHRRMAMRHWGR